VITDRLLYFVAEISTKSFMVDMVESLTGMKMKGKWLQLLETSQVYIVIFLVFSFFFFLIANPKVISKALGFLLVAILGIFFLNLLSWMVH